MYELFSYSLWNKDTLNEYIYHSELWRGFFNNIHETDEKLTSEAAVSFAGSREETGIFWPLDDDQGNLSRGIDNCGTSPLEGPGQPFQ